MGEELRLGDQVIHNGIQKEVTEIHGDVLILSDGSVVSPGHVSLLSGEVSSQEETHEDQSLSDMRQNEKNALRRNIEDLNEESSAVAVFALMKEVDPTLTIRAIEDNTVESIKRIILHRAITSGKIDPKVCGECGQRVPE